MKLVTTSHMRRGAFAGLALLLCMGGASAQVFKWVDANGKTHFSDRPPPASAKPAAMKGSASAASTASFPYALATAVRNYPVTLYTTASCAGCDQGRSFLKARGIPFTEKTVGTADDESRLKEAGGSGLPYLLVGSAKSTGFQAAGWNAMLSNAQYPETKVLPASYQYPAPSAAAPPKPSKAEEADPAVAEAAAAAEAEEKRRKEAAKKPTAPPGFQF